MGTFSAQIASFGKRALSASEEVLRQSAIEVVEDAQRPVRQGGRMRVRTGFLRASLRASTSMVPSMIPGSGPEGNETYTYDKASIDGSINALSLGGKIYFGWTASYAAYREYGSMGESGDAFMRLAIQRWKTVVAKNAAEVKSRYGF